MKKFITKKQWNELNNKQKIEWFDIIHFGGEDKYKTFEDYVNSFKKELNNWTIELALEHEENSFGDFTEGIDADLPNIGEMIEFLGDDWITQLSEGYCLTISNKTLCNKLWEAVKGKLANIT